MPIAGPLRAGKGVVGAGAPRAAPGRSGRRQGNPMSDAIDLGSAHLHGSCAEGVLRVVIDRPARRNALTIEMYHGLKKAAVLAERDPAVDVLLVTAVGDTFCVGGEMGGKHERADRLDRG